MSAVRGFHRPVVVAYSSGETRCVRRVRAMENRHGVSRLLSRPGALRTAIEQERSSRPRSTDHPCHSVWPCRRCVTGAATVCCNLVRRASRASTRTRKRVARRVAIARPSGGYPHWAVRSTSECPNVCRLHTRAFRHTRGQVLVRASSVSLQHLPLRGAENVDACLAACAPTHHRRNGGHRGSYSHWLCEHFCQPVARGAGRHHLGIGSPSRYHLGIGSPSRHHLGIARSADRALVSQRADHV
jgi:hypothetical protein